MRSLLGSFLLLVLFTHLPEYTSLLFHRILDHFLLPLLFPTPILSTSPTSPRSTHIPFLPLTQKLADTKNCPWIHGQKEAFIFLSISSTQAVLQSQPGHLQTPFSLSQENVPLQSSHSASVGQLPLLTAVKIAVPATEATTCIIYALDILADKKALFPFPCFFHLQGYK